MILPSGSGSTTYSHPFPVHLVGTPPNFSNTGDKTKGIFAALREIISPMHRLRRHHDSNTLSTKALSSVKQECRRNAVR